MSVALKDASRAILSPSVVDPLLRGVGQVFFQESSLAGVCFVVGIALSSLLMAVGAVIGSFIGLATARAWKFDEAEINAGIYGFNSTLVGIAALFFFRPSVASVVMLIAGCVVATLLTRWMRQYAPFPTYTSPFIVATWGVYFLGRAIGVAQVAPGTPLENVGVVATVAHGISQVMFQASTWTGLLFFVGIALNNRQHAGWVLFASFVGMLVASYHATLDAPALHIQTRLEHVHTENIALGLYGYNATLTAIALYLWRRTLVLPLLGILISVPMTEMFHFLGFPALTAPFVLSTWLVMGFGWIDEKLLKRSAPSAF